MSAGLRRGFHIGSDEQLHGLRRHRADRKPESLPASGYRSGRLHPLRQQRGSGGLLCPASGDSHRSGGQRRVLLEVSQRNHRLPGRHSGVLLWHHCGLRIHDGFRHHPGETHPVPPADDLLHHLPAGGGGAAVLRGLCQHLLPTAEPDHGLHADHPGRRLLPQGRPRRQRRTDHLGQRIQRADGKAPEFRAKAQSVRLRCFSRAENPLGLH